MKVIGIAGVARSGKDTLCDLLRKGLLERGYKSQRFALADLLKAKIRPFLLEFFEIDIFDCSPEEKELVRPLLVEFGRAKRITSEGSYWTGLLQEEIDKADCDVAIVTDIRYAEYEYDEADWLKEWNHGTLIHVERVLPNGEILTAPNADEERNNPKLKELANTNLIWESNLVLAKEKVDELLENTLTKLFL